MPAYPRWVRLLPNDSPSPRSGCPPPQTHPSFQPACPYTCPASCRPNADRGWRASHEWPPGRGPSLSFRRRNSSELGSTPRRTSSTLRRFPWHARSAPTPCRAARPRLTLPPPSGLTSRIVVGETVPYHVLSSSRSLPPRQPLERIKRLRPLA